MITWQINVVQILCMQIYYDLKIIPLTLKNTVFLHNTNSQQLWLPAQDETNKIN